VARFHKRRRRHRQHHRYYSTTGQIPRIIPDNHGRYNSGAGFDADNQTHALSIWQMLGGASILGISSFLLGRTTALSGWVESSTYRISYLTMAVGIAVAITGAIQLILTYKIKSA
jgi:hypothetical protein